MVKKAKIFFMIFRIIGLFVVGMCVAIAVALSQVNLETLRHNVVKMIQDATGTPVEVTGSVSWKFSLRPQIELNGVRIPNESWAKCENAFTADKIDVSINLISLLHDSPTIQNIRVYGVNVCIEKNRAGNLSVKQIAAADTKTDNDTIAEYPFSDPGFGGLELRDIRAKIFGQKYSVSGFQVRHMPHAPAREYAGWIKSDTDVFPFVVSFAEYDVASGAYPIRVAMSAGGDALIANMSVPRDASSAEFALTGDIPNIASFGRAFGLNWPVMPKMTVNLRGNLGTSRVHFDKSSLTTRGTELNFDGDYDWSRNKIKFTLNANKITMYELLPELFGGQTPVDRELNVFHDMPLYGDVLRGLNVNVRANIGSLIVYRHLRLGDVTLSGRLDDSHGRLDLRTGIAGGNMRVAANVDIDNDGRLEIFAGGAGQKISVGTILSQINIRDFISDLPVNLEFYLQGSGRDMSELMHTITGPVQMFSVGTGYAHSQLVANIYGADFLTSLRHEIQDMFRSEKKHDRIKISCVAVNTKIRDGKIETQNGVAAETAAINIGLAGDLDLGRERIKMSLNTVPVRGLKLSLTGNVVNSISISGNMAEPDVTISGAAVAGKVASATGIGLLLTPLTGGIGLVAGAGVGLLAGDLLENWLADDNPCETAMLRGAPSRRRDAEWINEPIEDLISDIFNNEQEQVKTKGDL